jgi:hypothetical protein
MVDRYGGQTDTIYRIWEISSTAEPPMAAINVLAVYLATDETNADR